MAARWFSLPLAAAFVTVLPLSISAQPQPIKIGVVGRGVPAPEQFREFLREIKGRRPDFPFDPDSVEVFPVSYDTPCELFAERTIATLQPLKFLECQRQLNATLTPLFLVKKLSQSDAFYTPYFITGRTSGIESLSDPRIRRIYLVNRNSASGYVAPLVKLADMGLIADPSERALRAKGWEVVFGGDQAEVLARLRAGEPAVAAVGEFPNEADPSRSTIRLLLRYDRLPQDPLVISRDLAPYMAVIVDQFERLFTAPPGDTVSAGVRLFRGNRITGLVRYDSEHRNAFVLLQTMLDRVRTAQTTTDGGFIPIRYLVATLATFVVGGLAFGWTQIRRRRRRVSRLASLRIAPTLTGREMRFDAFISHSTKDGETASAVCSGLEERGISCFIAPRNIPLGMAYDEALVAAIQGSRALILILSKHANESKHVAAEVRAALNSGLTVVPFRVEDFTLSGALSYHLDAAQWLDAITPPLEAHLDALASAVRHTPNMTSPDGREFT